MNLKDKLFSFEGRLRRQDWWIWGIAIGLFWVAAEGVATRLLFSGRVDLDQAMVGDPLPVLATSLALLALTAWPTAALYAKRAHDLNQPAWPVITGLAAVGGLPYLPYDLAPAFSEGPVTGVDVAVTVLTCILTIGWFSILVVLAFIDGAPGPNRFGPSPKSHEPPASSDPDGAA
jgi:uncharacterized membrane protein YhaH (DUF805 family)